MSMKYANSSSSTSWTLKCTDLPQFDALQAAADQFRTDDKLHLRNLCNDTARCAGLTAVHNVTNILIEGGEVNPLVTHRQRKMILDYSRQRITGETMELLFDLADAVALTDRR
jgi:glucose-6-phosphate isomerase